MTHSPHHHAFLKILLQTHYLRYSLFHFYYTPLSSPISLKFRFFFTLFFHFILLLYSYLFFIHIFIPLLHYTTHSRHHDAFFKNILQTHYLRYSLFHFYYPPLSSPISLKFRFFFSHSFYYYYYIYHILIIYLLYTFDILYSLIYIPILSLYYTFTSPLLLFYIFS
jgi:hypothetical protein